MKTSLLSIYKVELTKLIKKKDVFSILAIILLPFMLGVSAMVNQYTGPENQNAFYWVGTQLFNASTLYFTPVVFIVIAARTMAGEMENNSLLLYIPRVRNRGTIYMAKSLALTTFSMLLFIIALILNLLIYYTTIVHNHTFANGNLFGANGLDLVKCVIMLYFSSFLLVSQFTLFLSTRFKMMPTIGITIAIVSIFHFTWKVPYFYYINSWHYAARIVNAVCDVPGITQNVGANMNQLLLSGVLLCIILSIVFNVLGYRKFKELDL